MNKKLSSAILYFTNKETEKREFSKLSNLRTNFLQLNNDERMYKYIMTKAKYKKKIIMLSITSFIVLTTVFGMWNYLLSILEQAIIICFEGQATDLAIAKVTILISLLTTIILIITIVLIISTLIKEVYNLNKELELYTELYKMT